jgi:hypothetical protein
VHGISKVLLLHWMVGLHIGTVPAEAVASVLVTPVAFFGSKLWAFGCSPRPAIGSAAS